MGLEKNYFKTGQVLKAKEMNDIEDAIVQNEIDIKVLEFELSEKQETLESGTNIKTINGKSILGAGDLRLVSDAYSRDEIDKMFDNYVTEIAALVGGDA